MNQVIQSLVQSPFVRTMSAIPSKSEELVHGVDNFLPPLSRAIVRVPPRTGRASADVYQFDIPRRDYLDRMELVVRCRSPRTTANGSTFELASQTLTVATATLSNLPAETSGILKAKDIYSNLITSLEMYSKNRFIERLDPLAVYHETSIRNHVSSTGLNYHFAYSTVKIDPKTGAEQAGQYYPFPERSPIPLTDTSTLLTTLTHAQFHIPLPFCCMSMLRKNFQTSFLETLTLAVTTRHCELFQADSNSGYDMELVCYYHQFHPNVETVIRNANYKPGIPATLPWWEYVQCTNRLIVSSNLIQYSLDSDLLISEILVAPKWETTKGKTSSYLWTRLNAYLVLTCNGEVLYEGDAIRATQDSEYVLQDNETHMVRTHQEDGTMIIRFSLQYGEIFTGGLALASLNNVVLSVYPSYSNYVSASATATFPSAASGTQPFDVSVILKRHYLLRIDSDTGVVSRAIES